MYIVTGISRGLGKRLLRFSWIERKVTGIGRSNPFASAIDFIKCDLSDAQAVKRIRITMGDSPVTLINNAGIIGEIARMSEQASIDLEEVMQVNVFAPMELTLKVNQQLKASQEFTLVNISSGAAHRSIPSWAAYCASKAALNRLTENFYLEELELGKKVKAYAVAPGVIDTDMQGEIRSVPKSRFSQSDNFIQLKEDNKLFSSEEAARRLLLCWNSRLLIKSTTI